MTQRLSPAQIRQAAALAFRRRVRARIPDWADIRAPGIDESPLSKAEMQLAVRESVLPTTNRGA